MTPLMKVKESPVAAVTRVIQSELNITPSNMLVMLLIDAVRDTTPPPRETTIGMLAQILKSLEPTEALGAWAARSAREIVKILARDPDVRRVTAEVENESLWCTLEGNIAGMLLRVCCGKDLEAQAYADAETHRRSSQGLKIGARVRVVDGSVHLGWGGHTGVIIGDLIAAEGRENSRWNVRIDGVPRNFPYLGSSPVVAFGSGDLETITPLANQVIQARVHEEDFTAQHADADPRHAAIAALSNGTTLDEVIANLVQATNTTRDEVSYVRGSRAAMLQVLRTALSEIGYQSAEGTAAKWALEREATVDALRQVCSAFGDNEWEPLLHLADVINKHLVPYLQDLTNPYFEATAANVLKMFGDLEPDAKREVIEKINDRAVVAAKSDPCDPLGHGEHVADQVRKALGDTQVDDHIRAGQIFLRAAIDLGALQTSHDTMVEMFNALGEYEKHEFISEIEAKPLTANDIEWIVNSNAELGVKVGAKLVFLYKGRSLEYAPTAEPEMLWRRVEKREFGECCPPRTMPENGQTERYTRGEGWRRLNETDFNGGRPASPHDVMILFRELGPEAKREVLEKINESHTDF